MLPLPVCATILYQKFWSVSIGNSPNLDLGALNGRKHVAVASEGALVAQGEGLGWDRIGGLRARNYTGAMRVSKECVHTGHESWRRPGAWGRSGRPAR